LRYQTPADVRGDLACSRPMSASLDRHWRFEGRAKGLVAMVLLLSAVAAPRTSFAAAAKYYFQLRDVQSAVPLDGGMRDFVAEALRTELASRPEWESNLGLSGPKSDDAIAAALKQRKLAGFELVVKLTAIKKEVKELVPGSHLRRLILSVKLTVLGTTLPGQKIAFEGDGESGFETEVSESRADTEAQSLTKDGIRSALKLAVDQALMKLGMPKSAPMNEGKKKRKKS